jgi:PAS domain S-box-containing protein
MRTYRLQYKFLMAFIAFFVILMAPFSIVVYKDYGVMMERLDSIEPLSPEQRAASELHLDEMIDNFMFVSFYVFVLAFIFSLFFAKLIMDPVKQLYRGARDLSEGNFGARLDVTTSDELGEVTRAFNQMADTLRKQNEELRRKDLYLAAMVDPMWVVDEDNFITDINPAFSRLLGYGRDEVVGSSIFDFLDEEDGKVMRRKFFEADPAEPPAYEISVISKTEGLTPVLLSVSSIMEDGDATGRIGIIKDFRQEAALREALKEEKENTGAIMDSMVDHLLVVDRDCRILQANLAARVDMGERLVGEVCGDVLHGGSGRCAPGGEDCPARKVFDTGRSCRTVHEHVRAGQKRLFVEIVAYPVKDRRGGVKHAVLSMRDITERKKFEDEIERKNRELTMLSGISKILGRSLKAEDIFNRVLDKLIELVGMDGAGIYLLDEMHKNLMCAFHRGVSEGFVQSAGHIKLGEDIPGRVALTGNAFVSPDISRDGRAEKSVLKHSGVKAYACFPVMGKEKLAGVFFMFGFTGRVFTTEEERTFGSISEMMGISLENVRLYEKMRELYEQNRNRRAEEQRNLLDLSTMLATTLDLKKVLASSISLIRKTCRADFVWLLGLKEDGLALRAASDGAFAEGEEVYPEGEGSIERQAIEKKEPIVTRNLARGGKFRLDARLEKYGTACSVPLYIGDRALGAFTLYYLAARELREEEVHFLQTVGSVLAVALERTRLYENVIIQKGMAETVLESITDGVVTVDGEGAVMAMNSAAGRITGVPPEDAVGKALADMLGASPVNEGHVVGVELHRLRGQAPATRVPERPGARRQGRDRWGGLCPQGPQRRAGA